MATKPKFQPPVATFKNPAPTKDLPSNLRKIQHYQPSKPISSLGLMTKEQDYQPYQYGPAKKDPNGTRNRASLVENHYQEGATEMTYQAEEECVTQLANTRSSSVTG
ncbi:hypothetical protein G9A89_004735 [Geosiphon pyriformis]|nr:hypothetical protein G9A89_004735 [Geosiphon pyriformis]